MAVDIETIGVEFQTTGLEKGTRAFRENEAAAFRAADAADKTTSKFTAMDRAAMEAGRQLSTLNSALGGLGAVAGTIGILGGIRELTKLSDEYSKFTAQLKLASTSQAEFAASYQAVVAISKTAQSDLAATGVLYARIANGTRELGISQQQVAKITETVSLALKVSGATASESASAMLQLSQAFASGVLRGEEFNAVNEAAPRLMKALADGIGVPVGALRHMSEQGQLTSSILAESLPKALEGLRTEATSVQTISGAYTLLKNNVLQFAGAQTQANGTAAALSSAIAVLANNLELVVAAGAGVTTVKIADALVGIAVRSKAAAASSLEYSAALQAQRVSAIESAQAEAARVVALQASLAASQSALVISREESIAKLASANASVLSSQAQIAAARSAGALSATLALVREGEIALTAAMSARSVATAELAALGQQQARISAQIAAANAAHTASEAALTVAKAGGSAAAGIAARAMGLLGGPIGLITTLLGVGVTAWMAWGGAAERVSEEAKKSVLENGQELIDQVNREVDALRNRNNLLAKGYVAPNTGSEEKQSRLNELYREYDRLVSETGGTEAEQITRREMLRLTTMKIGQATAALNAQEVETARNAKLSGANQESLNNIRLKALGINAQTIKDTAEIARLRVAGLIDEKEYAALLKIQQDATINKSKADKASASEMKRAQEQFEQLTLQIGERIDLAKMELETGRQLTEAEKLEVKTLELLSSAKIKLTADQKDSIKAALDVLKTSELSVVVLRSEIALAQERAKIRQSEKNVDYAQSAAALNDINAAYALSLKSVKDRIRTLQDEEAAVQLSAAENITLAEAVERVAIARLKEKQAGFREGGDGYLALQQEIEAREKLLGLVRDSGIRSAWTSFWGDIYRGLTDSLYRGFEAGKGFFQSFWDGIKNTLKTTVLKVAVQGVLGFAGSALGVQGLAQAGPLPGLFGAANTASGIGNLGNLTGLGSSISSFGAGFSTGVSNLLSGMEGLGQSLDVATSLLEGGNLAGAAGTAAPYVLAAIAAYKLADSLFGSKGGPKTESGYGPGVDLRGDPASAKAISDSISAGYAQIAQTLGLAVKDLQVGVASAIDTAGDSLTQLQVVALQNGQEIYNRYTRLGGTPGAQENVGRTAEAYAQAVAEETARVMAAALANSELPQKFKDFLAAATDIPTAVQTVAQVAALDKRLAALGGPLKAVADLGVDAQLAFVNAAGGLDALDAATQRLMSTEEQRAYSIAKIQQQLSASGFAVSADAISSATAQSLREVLAGFDLTTEGGRRAANALLGVSGAILDLSASATSAQAAVRSAADILAERTGLEGQLYQLLGNTTVLRQRELDALDPGNRALQQHIYAVNDAQAAIESANTAYQQAQQAAQAQVSALESQRSAMASSISQLQQDMQRWVGLRKQASGLLGQIGTSLGGPSTQEADLWAQLTGGAELEAQLQAAQELYGLITQRNSAETQAAQTALQNAQGLLDVGKQLRAYVQGLRVGDLTALTPAQALAEAAGQYQATLGRAQGGDTDAQRALQAQADAYLRLAKQFDPEAYGSVFGSVSSQLDALGTTFMSDAQQQIALQQALVDAAGTANGLSADQLAKLQQLQGVVQGLYAQADGAATSTNAQLFVANANLASMDAQLTAARAAVESVASGVDAAKAALVVAQAEAAAYLAGYQGDIANSDPVPGLLTSLPANIAAALAPLINGTANVGSSAGGFDAGRAQTIRAYAATLSNDEAGAMAMYQAAVNNGVSSAELDAALGLAAGSSNAWAAAHNLPSFAVGIDRVPEDMVAQIHKDERILPAADNRRLFAALERPQGRDTASRSESLLAELLRSNEALLRTNEALHAEIKSLREQNNQGHALNAQATERGSQRMGDALERGAAKGTRAGLAAAVGMPT